MTVLFVEYPKCSTCKKAKAWLDEHGVEYIDRDIVLDNPTADELATWIARSGLPVRRFFNSSGMKYRELGLKARLDAGMTDQECYELLATDGMLVKRPLLVGDDFAIPGFMYIKRYIHHIGGLPDFTALRFTRYNQYESIILPMIEYLKGFGVQFHYDTKVTDVKFDIQGSRKMASSVTVEHAGEVYSPLAQLVERSAVNR